MRHACSCVHRLRGQWVAPAPVDQLLQRDRDVALIFDWKTQRAVFFKQKKSSGSAVPALVDQLWKRDRDVALALDVIWAITI